MLHKASCVVAAFVLCLCAFPAAAQEGLTFSSSTVSVFDYKGGPKRIFASLGNTPDNVSQWQFRYDPLYVPYVDGNGNLIIRSTELQNHSILIQIPIEIDNKTVRDLALNQLKLTYKTQAPNIQSNVFAFTVSSITLSANFNEVNLDNIRILSPTTNFTQPVDSFNINLSAPDKESAEALKILLPQVKFNYSVSFSAKSARQNNIRIKFSDLKNSSLFVKLNGLGTTETYVQRDDLRHLTENIHTQIDIGATIEAPDAFDNSLYDRIVNLLTTRTDTSVASFDSTKWASTYNSLDLAPDEINKQLNKEFTWDEGSHNFKFNTSIDTGGKVGLFDVLSAEGKLTGSYSQEDMQTWLKKHGIDSSFDGHKIVPKSIELQRVNMSQFSSDAVFSSVITLVSDENKSDNGNIDFATSLGNLSAGTPLPGRVAALEADMAKLKSELPAKLADLNGKLEALSVAEGALEKKVDGVPDAIWSRFAQGVAIKTLDQNRCLTWDIGGQPANSVLLTCDHPSRKWRVFPD